jgi:hypothetical protein
MLRAFLVLSPVVLVALTIGAAETSPPLSQMEKEIIDATNQKRQEHGLEALGSDPTLMTAARQHAQNMARQKTLSHELDGKSMQDRVKELDYKYLAIAENVAFNQPDAKSVVEGWMNSPGHRANILNKNYTQIGVGAAPDDEGQQYFTQVFGRPQSAGATAKASFTISNETTSPVEVTVPGQNSKTIVPAETSGVFQLAGMGELPKLTLRSNGDETEIAPKDGATYRITQQGRALEVSTEPIPSQQ